jgi:ribosomal protein S18 acetylase RimI-like enzyme
MELRKIDSRDLGMLRDWRNANAAFFPPGPEITESAQHDWYERYLRTPHDHQYLVCLEPPEFFPVGTLAIDIRSKIINRVVRGETEGKGAMSAAIYELMYLYGEGTYQLQVMEGNDRAIEFYKRLGFLQGGRQYTYKTNVAMINMALEYRT